MLGSANASVWDFLARSGPEEGLKAVPLGRDSSASLTGGQDWGITREGAPAAADLYYKDFSETQRFISMVESDSCVGPAPRGSHSLFPAPPGRHFFFKHPPTPCALAIRSPPPLPARAGPRTRS
jgi:hypothetical protein